VVLHSAALRRISAARLAFYDRAAAGPGLRGTWSGQALDRVMADADTAGMALIQATAPMITATAMTAGGCVVIAIAGYPLAAVIVAVAAAACAALAAAVARGAGDVSQTRASFRAELVTAVEAWPEMASLGAVGHLAQRTMLRLAAFDGHQSRRAAARARTAGAVRAVTAAVVLLTVALAADRGAAVATVVFLALLSAGVMTNAERLIPAAQARVLARQAGRRLITDYGQQPSPPSAGGAFRAAFDGRSLTVAGYRLPTAPPRAGWEIGFTAAAGQTLVVTGASGSGKTTLLNAVAAALRVPGRQPYVPTTVLADD
jgi:ATP-binding cassette, subfamily C, bacterial CydC